MSINLRFLIFVKTSKNEGESYAKVKGFPTYLPTYFTYVYYLRNATNVLQTSRVFQIAIRNCVLDLCENLKK